MNTKTQLQPPDVRPYEYLGASATAQTNGSEMNARSVSGPRWEQNNTDKNTSWKNNTLADRARTGHLSCTGAWLNLTTTLLWQIYYVLPATTLSPQQCKQIMQPYLQTGLAAAGYLKSFPRAIVHAPHYHFGLGLTDLHTEQGITHLLLLLCHGHCTDNLTRQLIWGSLKNMCLEMGFSGSIFMLPYNDLHCLATKSWVKTAWQFQQTHKIWLETDIQDLTTSRINDKLIMPAFYEAGFQGCDLACLNCCQIYVQCTSLADLCNGSGQYLNPDMWAGQSNTTFTSGYSWPRQSKPTKKTGFAGKLQFEAPFTLISSTTLTVHWSNGWWPLYKQSKDGTG